MGVSAPAHCLACRIVAQKFNCRGCDSFWILKGDQYSALIAKKLGRVPVRGRNDRLSGAQRVGQGSRYSLCLVAIGRNVNIGRTNQ